MSGIWLLRRSGVESRPLDGGAVLVDLTTGNCFELNRIGAEIWELLSQKTTEEAICSALAGRYPVERTELASDVRGLLEALKRHGLVDQTMD